MRKLERRKLPGLGRVSLAAALGLFGPSLGASAAEPEREPVDDEIAVSPSSTGREPGRGPLPSPSLNFFNLLPEDALIAEIERRHAAGGTFADLLERMTRGLLGAPYLISPLGDAEMPDPDPTFRLDAFDCTTFVETAIALSSCDDLREVRRMLDFVRYRGSTPRFRDRRHLVTSQWIPSLLETGVLEDVTEGIGGSATRWIHLELTEDRWKRRRIARALDLAPADVPHGTFSLPYIPVKAMLELSDRVPPGTILNVMRSDTPWTPEVITHQALILTRPGENVRIARHASPVSKRVIDETLSHMLTRYSKPKKWPIVGVNLLRIVDPGAAQRLPGFLRGSPSDGSSGH